MSKKPDFTVFDKMEMMSRRLCLEQDCVSLVSLMEKMNGTRWYEGMPEAKLAIVVELLDKLGEIKSCLVYEMEQK